jgi:hypothetical protein
MTRAVLEFEHIIQINDPVDSSVQDLSRTQLWQGLLLRARDPGKFNSALSCRIENEFNTGFVRYVRAGEVEYREQVNLQPQDQILTRTEGRQQIHAESTTTIEEPAAAYLYVRFCYRRELDETPDGLMLAAHLKSAYVQLDIDAIALIRMLAMDNFLGQRPS